MKSVWCLIALFAVLGNSSNTFAKGKSSGGSTSTSTSSSSMPVMNLIDMGYVSAVTGVNGPNVFDGQIISPVTSADPTIYCQPDTYDVNFGMVLHHSEFFISNTFVGSPGVKYVMPLNLANCKPGGIMLRFATPESIASSSSTITNWQFYIEDASTGLPVSAKNLGGCNWKGNWGLATSSLPAKANIVLINTGSAPDSIGGLGALEVNQSDANNYCSLYAH